MKRRGKGLFWKIFGGFLLTQILFSIITFGVTYALLLRSQANAWRDVSRQTMLFQTSLVRRIMENKKGQFQPLALDHFFHDVSKAGMIFAVSDEKGKRLAGNPLPPRVQSLTDQALHPIENTAWKTATARASQNGPQPVGSSQMELAGDDVFAVQWLVGKSGRHYALALQMPRIDVRVYGQVSAVTLVLDKTISSGMVNKTTPTIPAEPAISASPIDITLESLDSQTWKKSGRTQPLDMIPAAAVLPSFGGIDLAIFTWENALRTLALFVAAGCVCYGLALYLAAPVEALRTATEQVASGDLSARVGNRFRRRRDELSDLGHDFDRMAERLETLVESQRRLLADISHELRSPLARLAVASELAKQDAGPTAQPSLERIDAEANRMGELISQLLTFTKLENGLVNTVSQRFNLAPLVQEIAANAHFEASTKNCVVNVKAPNEAWITGSRPLIERAIENVIRNAVKYSNPGTTIEVQLTCSSSQTTLLVRDQGPGVPENLLPHLCEPFYRVDGARDGTGVGLGLSITQRAIESHQGTLKITNLPTSGLQVEITLPLSS